MKRMLFAGLLALTGCQLASESPDPPSTTDSAEKELDYSTWPSVTDEPYVVTDGVAMACGPPHVRAIPGWDPAFVGHMDNGGRGPHANRAIVVRVSPTGRAEFLARTPVPVGTVVVKEKLTDGKVAAVGTMTKREPGYDPDHGDWEYGYRELKADAPPPTAGKIDSCIACHRVAQKRDYLFRTYHPTGPK